MVASHLGLHPHHYRHPQAQSLVGTVGHPFQRCRSRVGLQPRGNECPGLVRGISACEDRMRHLVASHTAEHLPDETLAHQCLCPSLLAYHSPDSNLYLLERRPCSRARRCHHPGSWTPPAPRQLRVPSRQFVEDRARTSLPSPCSEIHYPRPLVVWTASHLAFRCLGRHAALGQIP